MPRRFVPAHLRKHGPGTAGRNEERNARICVRRTAGVSFEQLGQEFKMSREQARLIVRRAEWRAAKNKAIRAKWRGVFASTRQNPPKASASSREQQDG